MALVQMRPDPKTNDENAQLRRAAKMEHYELFPYNVWSYSLPGYRELSFQEARTWHVHNENGQQQIFLLGLGVKGKNGEKAFTI